MRFLKPTLKALALLFLLALAAAAMCSRWSEVFVGPDIYFLDPDCYSRMTRVALVQQDPWHPIAFQDFENAPYGIITHATAPLDYLIALPATLLHWLSVNNARDLAGAFISPVLGLLLLLFLWFWAAKNEWRSFRLAALFSLAASPILAHGFALGRPDHQSLIILLTGIALASELAIWWQKGRLWGLVSAISWALACWVSLFEPLVLLGIVLILRFLALGKKAWPSSEDMINPLIFAGILLAAFSFEGWRFAPLDPEVSRYFPVWSLSIGELRNGNFPTLFSWVGWFVLLLPPILLWRAFREKSRAFVAAALFLVALSGLSFWYLRWGYFASLAFALTLPIALQGMRWKPLWWGLFIVGFWPVAANWDALLYPDPESLAARRDRLADSILLREMVPVLKEAPEGTIVLGPWWVSPALAYWSGQRMVTGSSHQSLPGTVDSAEFFLTDSPDVAREVLKKRDVDYVLAYDTERLEIFASSLLGKSAPEHSMARVLYEAPQNVPGYLELVFKNRFFRLYRVSQP